MHLLGAEQQIVEGQGEERLDFGQRPVVARLRIGMRIGQAAEAGGQGIGHGGLALVNFEKT